MTPLEEAQQLFLAASEDTQFRTVASRAYFATFNRAKAFATAYGFRPVRRGDDHQGLADFPRSHPNPMLVRIGLRLRQMRALRNRADYEFGSPFTQLWAKNVLQDAETVEMWIANVKQAASGPASAIAPEPPSGS